MAFNLENPIGEGTYAELLVLYKACLARIAVAGQSYQMRGGRIFTSANLTEVRNMVDWLEAKVQGESNTASQVNYARRMRPA